jgi:uncharacterized protein YjbJ (UPF0337 family)
MKNTQLKSGTRDEIEGTAKNLAGKVKEATGKALGNPRLASQGRYDQLEGKTQKKIGQVKKLFDQ